MNVFLKSKLYILLTISPLKKYKNKIYSSNRTRSWGDVSIQSPLLYLFYRDTEHIKFGELSTGLPFITKH